MLADTVWARKTLPSNIKQMTRTLRTAELYSSCLPAALNPASQMLRWFTRLDSASALSRRSLYRSTR